MGRLGPPYFLHHFVLSDHYSFWLCYILKGIQRHADIMQQILIRFPISLQRNHTRTTGNYDPTEQSV